MRTRNRIRTCTARALNAVPPASWATRASGRATDLRASGRARTGYLRCTRAAHPLSCCAGVAAPRPGRAWSAYVSSAGFEPAPSAPSTPCLYRWATRIGPGGNPGTGGHERLRGVEPRSPPWQGGALTVVLQPPARAPLEARQSLRRGSNPRYPSYRDGARPVGRRHGVPRAGADGACSRLPRPPGAAGGHRTRFLGVEDRCVRRVHHDRMQVLPELRRPCGVRTRNLSAENRASCQLAPTVRGSDRQAVARLPRPDHPGAAHTIVPHRTASANPILTGCWNTCHPLLS